VKWFFLLVFVLGGNVCADRAVIEFPIAFDTTQTPSLSTELRVGAGLGFTHYFFDFHGFHLGYGLGLTFLPSFWRGTQKVYSVGFDSELSGRFNLAYGFDGTTFSFWPYVFIGPDIQLKITKLNVFEDADRVYAFDFGFLGGAGIKTRLGGFEVKIDTAAGYGLSGVNLRTTIMFGFGIF